MKTRFLQCLPALVLLALLPGCDDSQRFSKLGPPPPAQPKPQPESSPQPQPQPGFIVGKTTQDVRRADTEIAEGGAQPARTQINASDPLNLASQSYIVSVDRIAEMNVKHAIDLYYAETGEYPKDYQEFMDKIIKPGRADGIALPQLPNYQEYGYDEKAHKLIVLEYPDRKTAAQKARDAGK